MASKVRLFIVFLLLLMPTGLFAQARLTAADLAGTVQDQSGAVLPGVTVTATNTATNQSRVATTGTDGHYVIRALQPGLYTIGAELGGFAPQQRTGIRLVLGQRAELDFALRAGATETIT